MAVVINVTGTWNDKDIKKAQADLAKLGKTTQATGTQTKRSFGDATSSVKTFYAALAGAAVAKFAVDSVREFSDVQDATDALSATFGDSGQRLIDWANTAADAFNLSRNEALHAEQTFANFARSAGLSGQQLEGFSIDLTKRAADMASYFGGSTADAIEAISAALRGEQEPIRKYGVLMDDATLRAKALEMGLISTTKNALTPQQKVLAANAVLMKQTSQVQGDVERTAGSMGNQIKDAQQQFADLKASVGETVSVGLLPLMQALNKAVGAFNALPQPVKSVALVAGTAAAAFVYLAPKVKAAKEAVTAFAATDTKLKGFAKGGAIAVGIIGVAKAIGVLSDALYDVNVNSGAGLNAINKQLTDLVDVGKQPDAFGFKNYAGNTRDFNDALNTLAHNDWWRPETVTSWARGVVGMTNDVDQARESISAVDEALAAMVTDGHGDQAAAAIKALGDNYVKSGGSLDDFTRQFPQYNDAVIGAAKSTDTATVSLHNLEPAVTATERATKRLTTTWKALDGALGKQDARDQAIRSLKDLDDALEKSKGKLRGNSDAALDARAALRGSVGDIATYAKSFKDPQKQIEVLNDKTREIRKVLRANGVSQADMDKLLGPLLDAKQDMKKIGSDMGLGLSLGLDSKLTTAFSSGFELSRQAILGARKAADVNSPSRKTMKIGQELVEGLNKGILKDAGGAEKVMRDFTKRVIDASRDELSKLQAKGQQVLDFVAGIKSQVASAGSVTGFVAGEGPTTLKGVLTSMSGRVAEAKKFADAVGKLRGLHLNNASLQEIISAGPHDGLQIAQALLSGGLGAVGEVNSLEKQLNAAAARLGDQASLSQYGYTAGQAKALAKTEIHIEKGAVQIALPDGIRPADAAVIRRELKDVAQDVAREIRRELEKGRR